MRLKYRVLIICIVIIQIFSTVCYANNTSLENKPLAEEPLIMGFWNGLTAEQYWVTLSEKETEGYNLEDFKAMEDRYKKGNMTISWQTLDNGNIAKITRDNVTGYTTKADKESGVVVVKWRSKGNNTNANPGADIESQSVMGSTVKGIDKDTVYSNPWDRYLSTFRFHLKDGTNLKYLGYLLIIEAGITLIGFTLWAVLCRRRKIAIGDMEYFDYNTSVLLLEYIENRTLSKLNIMAALIQYANMGYLAIEPIEKDCIIRIIDRDYSSLPEYDVELLDYLFRDRDELHYKQNRNEFKRALRIAQKCIKLEYTSIIFKDKANIGELLLFMISLAIVLFYKIAIIRIEWLNLSSLYYFIVLETGVTVLYSLMFISYMFNHKVRVLNICTKIAVVLLSAVSLLEDPCGSIFLVTSFSLALLVLQMCGRKINVTDEIEGMLEDFYDLKAYIKSKNYSAINEFILSADSYFSIYPFIAVGRLKHVWDKICTGMHVKQPEWLLYEDITSVAIINTLLED